MEKGNVMKNIRRRPAPHHRLPHYRDSTKDDLTRHLAGTSQKNISKLGGRGLLLKSSGADSAACESKKTVKPLTGMVKIVRVVSGGKATEVCNITGNMLKAKGKAMIQGMHGGCLPCDSTVPYFLTG